MEVTSATQPVSTTPAATSSTSSGKSLDYDAFLQLLVAQLKNQDPTKPMDPAQQMAQLASFSNVEQGIKMNSKLDALLSATALSQAEGLIGHTVVSDDGTIAGQIAAVRVTNEGPYAILTNGKELLLGPGVMIG